MNIFRLSDCPVTAAQMMCDKHVNKMVIEAAQMLSTAHRMLDGTQVIRKSKSGKRMVKYYEHPDPTLEAELYKAVHHNHPSSVWTRESDKNYLWHYRHFIALCDEFEFRFTGKPHMSRGKLENIISVMPSRICVTSAETPFRLAMAAYPQCIVPNDTVQSYRNFYVADKLEFAKWEKGRPAPSWWTEAIENNLKINDKKATDLL